MHHSATEASTVAATGCGSTILILQGDFPLRPLLRLTPTMVCIFERQIENCLASTVAPPQQREGISAKAAAQTGSGSGSSSPAAADTARSCPGAARVRVRGVGGQGEGQRPVAEREVGGSRS